MATGGCQRDIAKKIRDKKADYVLALKGNQGTLRDDAEAMGRLAWRCATDRLTAT